MKITKNQFRANRQEFPSLEGVPRPSIDAERVKQMLERCPKAGKTPLIIDTKLAAATGIKTLFMKDERQRMGLGSFKALGAAYVIACEAENGRAKDVRFVTASAGNHGLSVAAGASAFGAKASIYLSKTVPESFAERLRAFGADVVRAGEDYEASMEAAKTASEETGSVLLSDSSWEGYFDLPWRLMEGYLALAEETCSEAKEAPSHIFLQAGVGGLASSAAAYFRAKWGNEPKIIVVEPDFAPALKASIEAKKAVCTTGPVSVMGRLDCKEPSLIALKALAQDADYFVTIKEEEAHRSVDLLSNHGVETTTSGAAGLAALMAAKSDQQSLELTAQSSALVIISEGS